MRPAPNAPFAVDFFFLSDIPQGYGLGFNSCSSVQQRYGVLLSLVWW